MLTLLITGICVVVYFLQIIGIVDYRVFGLIPSLVKQGEVYRIVTCMFLHGSIYHLMSNMYAFINWGNYCERRSNFKEYLFALILSGVGSGIFVMIFSRQDIATIGFSGVVFGILGYFATLLYKEDKKIDSMELGVLIRLIIPNIIISLMPGVSWQGHLGGFIGGVTAGIISLLLSKKNKKYYI